MEEDCVAEVLLWTEEDASTDGEDGSRSGAGLRRVGVVESGRERLLNLRRRVLFITSPLALRTSHSTSSSSAVRVDWVDSLKVVVAVGGRSVVAPSTSAPRAR